MIDLLGKFAAFVLSLALAPVLLFVVAIDWWSGDSLNPLFLCGCVVFTDGKCVSARFLPD